VPQTIMEGHFIVNTETQIGRFGDILIIISALLFSPK